MSKMVISVIKDYFKFFIMTLTFQVNELQFKIKDTTRKMMAMVSEVSMNQANAMKLQQSLKEKESELEQCYIRMEKGEPPSEEIERDWLKFLRDEERKAYEYEEKRLVCYKILLFPFTAMLSLQNTEIVILL